jgi:hypothetical protein
MTFTKGEWVQNGQFISCYGEDKNKTIAEVLGSRQDGKETEDNANAHLIAAAPDMYLAVDGAIEFLNAIASDAQLKNLIQSSGRDVEFWEMWNATKRLADYALSKARGEQQTWTAAEIINREA